MLLVEVLTFSMGTKMVKNCLRNHGQSCCKGEPREGSRAGGAVSSSDLPAEDVLVSNSQAKECGLGDPWEASAWEEGGQGLGEEMVSAFA